jgi:outer membrane protein
MKTTVKILAICAFFFAAMGSTYAQVKIGHVNVDELLGIMPEAKAAQEQLETYTKQLENDFQEMEAELEAKYRNFEQNQKMMTELRREKEMEELQDLQMRMQDFQRKAQEDFENKQRELLTPIIEKAQKAINEVAEENSFSYVMDSSRSKGVVIFTGGGENILALVKTKLGIVE